jgi:D-glycero-D-manno-heptose 1,7-bisphosphate phosphatase
MGRPAVFLDRDGVLVEEVYYAQTGEWDAPWCTDDVRLLPGAAAGARRLAEAGFALVLISNQAAFAKGKTSLRNIWLAHERFVSLLAGEGAKLDAVFYAYGHPDGIVPQFTGPSLERKPGAYNLFVAAAQLDLDLTRSWMVGDRDSDIACARAAGVQPVLVANPHLPVQGAASDAGIRTTSDLMEAAAWIIFRTSDRRG